MFQQMPFCELDEVNVAFSVPAPYVPTLPFASPKRLATAFFFPLAAVAAVSIVEQLPFSTIMLLPYWQSADTSPERI
jgi:hypothetical protein